MKQLNFLLLAFSILLTAQLQGQTRYLDEVFSNVNVETDVIYGTNISVVTGSPMASNLLMDVYTPVGDDATERPVVIYLHTGSFLPQYFSRQITGLPSSDRSPWFTAVANPTFAWFAMTRTAG